MASRIAVTASASSPGASGASAVPLASDRSSSSTQIRSGSRPKFARQQSRRLGPHRRDLAGCGHAHADPVAELDLRADGEADQRRDRAVRMPLAVERALELLVGAREGGVVPVEAATALGGAYEERHEHAAIDGAPLVPGVSLVRVGEDPRRRLAQQIGDGVLDVDPREEPLGPRLDEAAHERAVLVERRPTVRAVLLERERQVDAVLELAREDGEGAETEAPERVVEVRRAHPALLRRRHVASYLAARAPVGGARVFALWGGAEDAAAAGTGAARAAVDAPSRPRPVERRAHLRVRGLEHGSQLGVVDVLEAPPRRDARLPERLGLPEVPDPGHEPLVEQGVADLSLLRSAAQARKHRRVVGRLAEDVGTQTRRARGRRPARGRTRSRARPRALRREG